MCLFVYTHLAVAVLLFHSLVLFGVLNKSWGQPQAAGASAAVLIWSQGLGPHPLVFSSAGLKIFNLLEPL